MFEIPAERLPPGFVDQIAEGVEQPAEPKPSSTIVLARDAGASFEVLLLKRHRASGFVPGAYVFPGGRVDEGDRAAALVPYVYPAPPREPELAYWIAAVRETFEETGVLLVRETDTSAECLREWRTALLEDERTFSDIVLEAGLQIDLSGVVYFAHWITPVVEPRRYDTRFFLARTTGTEVGIDAREMEDAVWLTPEAAVRRFEQGQLPMVFPTLKTLEQLCAFTSLDQALDSFKGAVIEPILPRLVRTERGAGIVIDEK